MTARSWLTAALLALTASAQESDEPAVLGKPANWAIEAPEAETLVPIAEGSAFYLEPDRASTLLLVLPESRLPLVESRAPWVRVRYGDRLGWVDLEAPLAPSRAPAAEAVARPEPLDLGQDWHEQELGPYALFSKVDDRGLIELLSHVAEDHARLYAERYGLAVDPTVGGSIVLFGDQRSFLEFKRERGHELHEGRIAGYFRSPDLVVMFRGFNSKREVAATAIHELTHLVTWQVLQARGRAVETLPPWLDEGMADDLSLSLIDRQGRLAAEPLAPGNLHYGPRLAGILLRLSQDLDAHGKAPALPDLLAMDDEAFFAGDNQIHYLMASLWIRYLLSDVEPGLADGFRAFLASVVDGGSEHPDALAGRLGRDWRELSNGFRVWLLQQRARFGV